MAEELSDGRRALPGQTEQPPPPDVPQQFETATSYRVRDALQEYLERDLLGPWGGEDEVLPPRSQGPGERYLVGRLGPRHEPGSAADRAKEAATVDADVAAGGDGADPELPDLLTAQNAGRMWASSMGLSCVVAPGVDILTVTVSWGQYAKSDVLDDAGNPHRQWSREPVRREIHPRLNEDPSRRYPLTGPEVYLVVEVRPGSDGKRVVEIGLVNAQQEPPANADTAWLFQPQLVVTAAVQADRAVFCPIDDPLEDQAATPYDDAEERHLRLLYRNRFQHAVGRNVAVHAQVRPGDRCAWRLETTWLPSYEVPATVAPPAGEGTPLGSLELSMEALADASAAELAAMLTPLAHGYTAWLDEQAAKVPALPDALKATAEAAIFTARQCAQRIRTGIDLVSDPAAHRHAEALAAFCFANRAMLLQRQHTDDRRRAGKRHGLPGSEGPGRGEQQEGRLLAPVPAGVHAAQPARAHRPAACGPRPG